MLEQGKIVIRAIASDWGKVVVDYHNEKVGRALEPHSTAYDAGQIYRIMFDEQHELFDAYMRGHLTTAGFRKAMRRMLQLTCTDGAFDAAFADVFTPNEPIIALWKRLRGEGVKMTAASNVEELRHAKLKEMGVHDLFDTHGLSYELGHGKPDEDFYSKTWKKIYLNPPEILFVDDKPENVEAAQRQLWTGFLYDLHDHAAFERFLEGVEFRPYRIT